MVRNIAAVIADVGNVSSESLTLNTEEVSILFETDNICSISSKQTPICNIYLTRCATYNHFIKLFTNKQTNKQTNKLLTNQ